MIDTINLYHGVEPEQEARLDVSGKTFNEISQYNNPKGTTYYRKRQLLNGKIIVNYSERANREMTVVSKNRFINISSLSYLLGAETNLATVGPNSLKQALRKLEKLLKDEGIEFDVQNAKISRIDLTLNLKLPNPVFYYFPVLRLLQPTGFEKHEHDGTNLTFRKSNENSIILYDKLEQLKRSKDIPVEQNRAFFGLSKDEHVLRVEHQFRRARQAQQHLGISSVSDLMQNRNMLASVIKEEFKNMLSCINNDSLNLVKNDLNEHYILSTHIKGNETLYYHFGLLRTCNENIDETLKLICDTKGISNQRFMHRTRKKLQEALKIHKSLASAKDSDRYSELLWALRKPIWR